MVTKRKTKWVGTKCRVTRYRRIFIGSKAFCKLIPARSMALCEEQNSLLHGGGLHIHDIKKNLPNVD